MFRLGAALATATLVASGGLVGATHAVADQAPSTHSAGQARGLIVKRLPTIASSPSLLAAARAAAPEADVTSTRSLTATTDLVLFGQPIASDAADAAAKALQAQPGVLWAVPDTLKTIQSTPDLPSDPKFGQQWDMWDGTASGGG